MNKQKKKRITKTHLLFQLVAGFERILGLKQSVTASFTANFHQVLQPILTVAKERAEAKKLTQIKSMLALLERTCDDDDDDAEPTLGEGLLI